MPVFAIDVTLRPPIQTASRDVMAESRAVDADLPAPPPAKPDAPRLLAPLPIPVEKIGAENAPAAPIPGLIPENYLPTSALSKRPKPASEPQVQLPPGWLEASGQARLTLYVNATGQVDAVIMGRTNLSPELHGAVRDSFQNLQFSPGEIDGRPVASMMTIEVDIASFLGNRH